MLERPRALTEESSPAVRELDDRHTGHDEILGRLSVSVAHLMIDRMCRAEEFPESSERQQNAWPEYTAVQRHEMAVEELEGMATMAETEYYLLADVRMYMYIADVSTDPTKRDTLERYMDNPSTGVPQLFASWRGDQGWAGWLQSASDDQLLNFAQWHNYKMVELQNDPEVRARIDAQKQAFKGAVQRAIVNGDLPQSVGDRLSNLDTLDIRIGDLFDLEMKSRAGYYRSAENFVIISADEIESSSFHEFCHAIMGDLPYEWMREGMTEYIAESLKRGSFGPIVQEGDTVEGVYTEEQRLMHTICTIIAEEFPNIYPSCESATKRFVAEYVDWPSSNLTWAMLSMLLAGAMSCTVDSRDSFKAIDETIKKYTNQWLELQGSDKIMATD